MIVHLRTRVQAEKVAAATGGVQLPGKPKRDGTSTLSTRVDVGADFEAHRDAVEAVSVLFTLLDTDPSTGELVEVPSGWVLQAYRYALDPTPAQVGVLDSHAGAARFAYNTMLAAVKANLDQRKAERSYGIADDQLTPVVSWSFQDLRNRWNQIKHQVAVGVDGCPWWQQNSKEAYANAVANLTQALSNWDDSRTGERKGPKMGFPRFKRKGRSAKSFTFTTGTIRVEPSRHHVTLPVVGTIHTHESTRKLGRRIESGTAQILSATVRFERGRWLVSFTCAVRRQATVPLVAATVDAPVVGIDAGVKDLLVVATPDGAEIARHSAPRELKRAVRKLTALQRKLARQRGPWDMTGGRKQDPSNGWQKTQDEIACTHARVANLRSDRIHKLTTSLAKTHQVIGGETLAVKNMMHRPKPKPDPDNPGAFLPNGAGAKSGLNRALADAGLGEMFRQLDYKTHWYGSHLVKADRWFPSSKMCSGCGAVKAKLHLWERVYHCEHCGLGDIDRDLNAAINLARYALKATAPSTGVVTGGADRKTVPSGMAGGSETGTVSQRRARPKGRAA